MEFRCVCRVCVLKARCYLFHIHTLCRAARDRERRACEVCVLRGVCVSRAALHARLCSAARFFVLGYVVRYATSQTRLAISVWNLNYCR